MITYRCHQWIVFIRGDVMRSAATASVLGSAIAIMLALGSGGAALAGRAGEGEAAWLKIARPLDVPAERLERPRPEQDRLSRPQFSPALSQAEVIKSAKAKARKELGKRFNDYEVRSVIFESSTSLWLVTFDRNSPHRSPDGCVVVFVHDKDKTIDLQRCR